MKILSINVGTPKPVSVRGGQVLTSIFKAPLEGRVAVVRHNIAGDRQADLTVHGGPYKAVYAYASEHYHFWKEQLPEMAFSPGAFGENLTTEGLTEEDTRIGDRFRIGTSVLQVSQPRMPCFKLNLRFERADMVKRFWQSGRSGIYFSVVEEGELAAGDEITRVAEAKDGISVAEVVRLYRGEEHGEELTARAMRAPLYGGWKKGIRERSGYLF